MFNLFESQEEKEAKRKAFQEKIFPHGDGQRNKVKEALEQTFPERNIKQLLYEYIILKEKVLDDEKDIVKINLKPKMTDIEFDKLLSILEEDLASHT